MNKLSDSVSKTNIKSSTEKCIKKHIQLLSLRVGCLSFDWIFLRTLQALNKRQVVWLQRYKV